MACKIYVATFSEDAVNVIKENNLNIELNDLCISENLDAEKREMALGEMEKEITDSGAEQVIIHGPFTELCPGSIDHRAIDLAFDRLNEAFNMCMTLGVSRMVVHSGYMPLIYYKEWHLQKSIWFWKEYMKEKPEDFQIFIENVFEDEPYMMKELVDGIDDSRVGICLDVGHANAMTKGEMTVNDWIKILGLRIRHFHLHNNDGTHDLHNPMNQGTMDMETIIRDIFANCSDVTFTLESTKCREDVKWMKESHILEQLK